MNRKSFCSILDRYVEGTCPEAEKKLVEQWYELLGHETAQQLSAQDIKATLQRLWPVIKQRLSGTGNISREGHTRP
jgi:transmembrane sensor